MNTDVVFVLLSLAFFALSLAYAHACEKVR
jgi:hypothetical protein